MKLNELIKTSSKLKLRDRIFDVTRDGGSVQVKSSDQFSWDELFYKLNDANREKLQQLTVGDEVELKGKSYKRIK